MQETTQQQHATQAQPVFVVVYVEGSPAPVFKGLTSLALNSEKSLRSMLLTMFPQVRKVAIAVLGTPTRDLPDFMQRTGGHFLFSATAKVKLAAPPTPRKRISPKTKKSRGHSKRKKSTKPKPKQARKPLKKHKRK